MPASSRDCSPAVYLKRLDIELPLPWCAGGGEPLLATLPVRQPRPQHGGSTRPTETAGGYQANAGALLCSGSEGSSQPVKRCQLKHVAAVAAIGQDAAAGTQQQDPASNPAAELPKRAAGRPALGGPGCRGSTGGGRGSSSDSAGRAARSESAGRCLLFEAISSRTA